MTLSLSNLIWKGIVVEVDVHWWAPPPSVVGTTTVKGPNLRKIGETTQAASQVLHFMFNRNCKAYYSFTWVL